MHGEALLVDGLAHDLQRGRESAAGPVDEPAGEALIGEHTRTGVAR